MDKRYMEYIKLKDSHQELGEAVNTIRKQLHILEKQANDGEHVEEALLETVLSALRIRLQEYYEVLYALEVKNWRQRIVFGMMTSEIAVPEVLPKVPYQTIARDDCENSK